ncbi:LCP family protein [Lacticaseibacillus manihotivorans]|jgi:LCP family protein required for cell wall assembly|uniref:Transcriptional regulator n=2 Tax=Lacticaseibacillus manihotivorans TaxID=88233 RepID=A0A0R1Q4T0_9LACO|nr:LCP family protein [Lacticaseibacillus manihotivorans]KRL39597.1 Transcriptional regulator [Lacticaseibacillus manihotivorans DSM 13343 = JCM 12514]QFQ90463.1 LytR family transcriptional regulator [Lacticaseibacillus manihotivorans]
MQTRSSRRQQPHSTKPWVKWLWLVITVALFSAGAYGLRLYSQAKYAIDSTYSGLKTQKVSTDISNKKPFAALLLGVDTGALGRTYKGNSDTMIVAVVNPQKHTTKLISIPRDTVAQLIGTKSFNMQKINAAYNVGGSDMAINTVSKLVNVPIKYYLTINMGGLEKVVDDVGGVDVNVPFSYYDSHSNNKHFVKGKMHLNGEWALAYARMRHEDPQGDYGRQKRQQQVIKAILKKAVSFSSLSHFTKLLDTVSSNIQTNLTFSDMQSIFLNYRSAAKNVSTGTLQGQSAGVYSSLYDTYLDYQIPSTDAMQKVSDELRAALGLKSETINNENVKENAANSGFSWTSTADQTYTIYNPDL